MKKVVVDRTLCVGTGNCERIARHIFEVADDGIVVADNDKIEGADDWELVEDAVLNCPTQALSITDDQ